ncbi:MAG: bifunctional aspartate kinase/homoserine dehydrogenase I, partial [Chlorobiaceae bacterium]
MKIYKFGGTSLGTAGRIKKVADILVDAIQKDKIVVVVSAIHRVTDLLLESATKACSGESSYRTTLEELDHQHLSIAGELFSGKRLDEVSVAIRADLSDLNNIVQGVFLLRELSEKSLALVMSFGERLSACIVSSYLQERGMVSFSLDARELIVTDANYADAR